MPLTLVTDPAKMEEAFELLSDRLKEGSKLYPNHNVGWPSDNDDFDVYWQPALEFWATLRRGQTSYLCGYGLMNPALSPSLELTVQINPTRVFTGNSAAGAFLADGEGNFWLAHTGVLTKGHGSLGTQFIDQYEGPVELIDWPNGKAKTLLVIGQINDSAFLKLLAQYVKTVAEFKSKDQDMVPLSPQTAKHLEFVPEFEGPKATYTVAGEVQSIVSHGYVINGLQKILKRNYDARKNGAIDLFLRNEAGEMTHIFEAKTNGDRYSVYCGVGQLLLHAALEPSCHKRILVLPGKPKPDLLERLDELGILVLRYTLDGNVPEFSNLDDVL